LGRSAKRKKKLVYYYKHVENQISVHKLSTGGDKWYPIKLKVYFPPPPFFWLLRVMASSFLRFLDHTQQRSTVGRTPLDE